MGMKEWNHGASNGKTTMLLCYIEITMTVTITITIITTIPMKTCGKSKGNWAGVTGIYGYLAARYPESPISFNQGRYLKSD